MARFKKSGSALGRLSQASAPGGGGGGAGVPYLVAASTETATTAPIPAHEAGDLILVFIASNSSPTIPGTPAGGWVSVATATNGSNRACRAVYLVDTNNSVTSITIPSSHRANIVVFRGAGGIGGFSSNVSTVTTTTPAINEIASLSENSVVVASFVVAALTSVGNDMGIYALQLMAVSAPLDAFPTRNATFSTSAVPFNVAVEVLSP